MGTPVPHGRTPSRLKHIAKVFSFFKTSGQTTAGIEGYTMCYSARSGVVY